MTRENTALQLDFLADSTPAPVPVARGTRGRYDRASEEEASAIGRALLADLRGEPLTTSQQEVLETARSAAPAEARVPAPVMDRDTPVLSFARGDKAEVRVRWRRYRGSAPFLDVRRFERGDRGDLLATRQGVTFRGHELSRLISELVKLQASEARDEAAPRW